MAEDWQADSPDEPSAPDRPVDGGPKPRSAALADAAARYAVSHLTVPPAVLAVSLQRESVQHPHGALLSGPCRVAPLEYPTLRCRQVVRVITLLP